MNRLPSFGLRGRLAISIAVIMLVALGVTYVAVYRGTGSDLRSRTEADLQREVDGLSSSLLAGPPGSPAEYTKRAGRLVLAQPFGPSSRLITITIENGGTATNQPELLGMNTSSGSPVPKGVGTLPAGDPGENPNEQGRNDGDRISANELRTAPEGFSTISVEDVGDLRLLTLTVDLPGGGTATVRVGQPLAPVEEALDGLSDTFLLVGLITLLFAAAAGWVIASRATRPMRLMAGVAEGVDGGGLSARMPIEATRNDEVRRLAESFNGMLDRLEDAFTRQREFVADASHDLRTPLTIVRGQLEVLARNPNPNPEDVQRATVQVTAATDRMERLVDDLLLLARAETGAEMRTEPAELEPLLVAEIEAFRETGDRSFEVGNVAGSMVAIDPDQMSRVISNLIANAVAHTRPGGRIAISAVHSGRRVVIAVDDDGPGVAPEMRERVFDRFKRLDESRASDAGGSGLGLAIVKAITEAHGGTVGCTDSPLGGARFSISLPAL